MTFKEVLLNCSITILLLGAIEFVLGYIYLDTCNYHLGYQKRGFIVKHFFDGMHPTPNILNFVGIGLIGILIGLLYSYVKKKSSTS